jgi:hypothetical protein
MTTSSNFFILAFLQLFIIFIAAYPTVLLIPSESRPVPSKRAFDRLDLSPFDFGSLSKRYYDDDMDDYEIERSKKAFDRLEESGFGFGMKKRAFDRLDHAVFDFGTKRSMERAKKPFDRLESSQFGMLKKRSISDVASAADIEPYLSQQH